MKQFFRALKRFIPPYKWYLTGNIIFTIISAILNLVSFALLIPILRILFRIDQTVYEFIPWDSVSIWSSGGIKAFGDVAMNNFNYFILHIMEVYGGSQALLVLGGLLVVMTLLKVLSAYAGSAFMVPLRMGVVRDIRNSINNKILHLHMGFFSEERKGDILARIAGDVFEIETSIVSSLEMLFKNPIMIIIFLTSMIIISPQLTLFVIILLPIAGWIMGQVGKKLKRRSSDAQAQWGVVNSMVEETLSGLRVIKAFNAEEKIQHRFESQNEKYKGMMSKVMMRQLLAHPMSEFLGTMTIAVVLWFGGTLILGNHSSIDASTFIYYLVIFYSIINPAKELSKSVYSVQKGLASLDRVDKIIKAETEIKDPIHPLPIKFESYISFENVSFKYDKDWILQDINLRIPKGATVALVGASGSGKSTLVDLIPRFYDVNEGRITIDGTDVRDVKLTDLRGLMGNVNQEAILFNDTIRNNITFGVDQATDDEVTAASQVANTEEFITPLPEGYETNIGDRGGKLSGGQRQRLSIARAILKNPDILILDEATSALDTASEKHVQEALDELMKGRTTIVIAHRLSTIVGADMIYVMDHGRIVEQGTHDELMAKNGHYANLVQLQQL